MLSIHPGKGKAAGQSVQVRDTVGYEVVGVGGCLDIKCEGVVVRDIERPFGEHISAIGIRGEAIECQRPVYFYRAVHKGLAVAGF